MERCKYELFIEKYYGLDPEKVNENGIIKTDYGDLCNLLAMFDGEQRDGKETPNELSNCIKPAVSGMLPEQYPDNEADGYVFCGKCGKIKEC